MGRFTGGGKGRFIRSDISSVLYKAVGFSVGALNEAMQNVLTFTGKPLLAKKSKAYCQVGNAIINDREGCSTDQNPPQAHVKRASIALLEAKHEPNCT